MSTPIPPRPTPVVPDYEVLRCIGRGAYGEVWLARSTLGTLRAVKVIYRDAFESDGPYLREFAGIRDFEPVSSHESQVRVYHVGQNPQAGYFYYVMDLADDASLAARTDPSATAAQPEVEAVPVAASGATQEAYVPATLSLRLLERGRLSVNECLDIAVALASALKHLHDHGLIHRDIKPANIVFVQGRPKLADIGLVTSASTSATFVGTAGYIPPEGPGRPPADIYSLGKVLYEMATGRDRADFPQLPEGFASLPDRKRLLELNLVILKACQNDPGKRYPSTTELHADLVRLQSGESVRRRYRLKKALVAAGLGAAALLMVAGGFALWRSLMPARAKWTTQPDAVPPPAGLIAWWPGDGHADDIVGNHHGVPVNGADYAPGFIGQAFRVNGTNQYFSIPDSPELSFTNGQPFTLEAWVYRSGGGLPFHVLGKRPVPATGSAYQMSYDDIATCPVPMFDWTHLVDTYESGVFKSYANGQLIMTNRIQNPTGPNNTNLKIGTSGPYEPFGGLIDDVRIYNRALAPSEIKAIYNAGTNGMREPSAVPVERKPEEAKAYAKPRGVPPPAGLIAWWPGDGHADDIVGSHHGVSINGADYAPGLIGQAFRVNGINQYFSIPHSPSLSFTNGQPYTLEAWVYRTGGGLPFHVLGKRDSAEGCWYQLGYDGSFLAIPLRKWMHLLATSDGKTDTHYYNGDPVGSRPARCPGPNFGDFEIGYAYRSVQGLIDDVRIYSRALAPSEIKAIYDAGTNGMSEMDPEIRTIS